MAGDVQVPLRLGKPVYLRPASLGEPERRLITAPCGVGVTRGEMPGWRRARPSARLVPACARRSGGEAEAAAPATCAQALGTWTGGKDAAHLGEGQVGAWHLWAGLTRATETSH